MSGRNQTATGVLFALSSIVLVQLGSAVSMPIFDQIGPAGTAWLRLCWSGVIFVAIARPRPWTMPRADLVAAVALGLVTAGMTVLFGEAIARIPLATAVSIEFLGPLTVAVLRRTGRWGLAWPPLALAGIALVTQPWGGVTNVSGVVLALGAGTCWGAYILLTQRVGDRLHGVTGLAISMPVAALIATPVGLAQALPQLDAFVIFKCAGLALLSPAIPYVLEMFALRKLAAATFGTLMSVEPAAALVVGLVILRQIPGIGPMFGILFVTVAAIGAARTDHRSKPDEAIAPFSNRPDGAEV
ncbi:EamA family transporter [Pendulispora albinea]|uniref:EamA family transporter n=1 Tax=Pendulispora albinea TaxID=2741071 RepID=A0ABZ2M356_9BACT